MHAYERINPVYNFTLDPCAPVHITVGDGGREPDQRICTGRFAVLRKLKGDWHSLAGLLSKTPWPSGPSASMCFGEVLKRMDILVTAMVWVGGAGRLLT